MVGALTARLLEGEGSAAVPDHPLGRGITSNPPSGPVDLKTLLQLAQQLYAHALTLQELIWSQGRVRYEAVKPKYDRQAAIQFKVLRRAFTRPEGLHDQLERLRGQAPQE